MSRSCSPVVPVLLPHGRAHRLEVRLAAETPDVPELDGLVLAVGDEVAAVSPVGGQFNLVFEITPFQYDFVMRFCATDEVNVTSLGSMYVMPSTWPARTPTGRGSLSRRARRSHTWNHK